MVLKGNMREEDRDLLSRWMRGIEVHDEDEDGIATIVVKFKIRGDPEAMRRIFNSMSHDDACLIASACVHNSCIGVEDFEDDWEREDSKFGISFYLDEDGFIVINGSYRT